MTLDAKVLEDFHERQEKVLIGGGEDKARARHEQGQLTARERLAALFQEGTFQEIGMHIRSTAQAGAAVCKNLPSTADGVIVGTGYVGRTAVTAFSQDFQVRRGRHSGQNARGQNGCTRDAKRCQHTGTPIVAFNDSGGALFRKRLTHSPVMVRCFTRTCCCPASCRRSRSSAGRAREGLLTRRR